MKQANKLHLAVHRLPAWSWLVAMSLLGAGLAFLLLMPLGQAGTSLAQDIVPGSPAVEPGTGGAQEVAPTAAMSYTAFLPMVQSGHWSYAPSSFGVQVYGLNPTSRSRISDGGAGWIRIPFSWRSIEPENTTPENLRWPKAFDEHLAYLSSRGVRVMLTLSYNPSWAATYPAGPIDQTDISEIAEFMQAAVAHYSVEPYNVKYWEIYNEPDNGQEQFASSGGVGFFGHNAQAYVDILQAIYQPMKDADPEAQIVMGGLAYDNLEAVGGPFVEEFLDNVLQKGGADYFDVMSFHYYLAFANYWRAYGIDILGKTNFMRDKLASHGVSKPMICSETGMWSSVEQGGSDELQSRYVPKVFVRSMAGDLDFTIWFMLSDDTILGGYRWGLLNNDLSIKPSYKAYQVLARQLNGARYSRTLTATEQMEAYEFVWPASGRWTVVAWTNDESTHTLELPVAQALVVDKYGAETSYSDQADGALDGTIHLQIGPSPVYLHPQP